MARFASPGSSAATGDICDVYLRPGAEKAFESVEAPSVWTPFLGRLCASEESLREVRDLYQKQSGEDEESHAS